MQSPPQRIVQGRYRLETRLGAGSGGEVWKASDRLEPGRTLAIKILQAPATRQGALEQLRDEFHALSQLRHPRLVEVFDYGRDPGTDDWFLTLALVDGPSLAVALPLPADQVVEVAAQVLEALAHVHAHGWVHADVKPGNILLPRDGSGARLGDFGLAALAGRPGTARGTLPYTAPEVLRGEAPGVAADLYALGATLYHAALGVPPFPGPGAEQIIEGHLRAEPALGAAEAARLPAGFVPFLRRLLAKDPGTRPTAALDALRTLDDLCGTSHAARAQMPALLATPSLCGREAEITLLDTTLSSAETNHEVAAGVIRAPSGAGVSRLLDELRIRAQARGWVTLSTSFAADQNDPLTAVLRLLHAAGALAGDDRPATPADLDALGEALRAALLGIAARNPVLVLLDDFHGAAEETRQVLSQLARGLESAAIVFVAGDRTDGGAHHVLAGGEAGARSCAVLDLGPLGPDATRRLLESALCGAADKTLTAWVGERAGGRPARALSVLRTLLARRALARDPHGVWQLAEDAERVPLAIDDEGQALAALAACDDDERAVLNLLAVAGSALPADRAALTLNWERPRLDNVVNRVERAERIRCDSDRFAIRDTVLREAIYHHLAATEPGRLADLHRQLAEVLAAEPALPGEPPAAIAFHFEAGGQPREAAHWTRRAADEAAERGARETAVRRLERALGLMAKAGVEAPEQAAALESLGDLERQASRPDAAGRAYSQALALLEPLPDHRTDTSRLLWKSSLASLYAGDLEAGTEQARHARAAYAALGDQAGEASTLNALGIAAARAGDQTLAETHYAAALALRRTLGDQDGIAGCLQNLGLVHHFQGRFEEAALRLDEARSLYETLGRTDRAAMILHNLGLVARERGRLDEARTLLRQAAAQFLAMGAPRARAECLLEVARLEAAAGTWRIAADESQGAAALFDRLGMPAMACQALEVAGDAWRDCGRAETAEETHARMIAIARRVNDPAQVAFGLLAQALDRLSAGDTDEAEARLNEARAVAGNAPGPRLRRRLARVTAATALARGRADDALAIIEPQLTGPAESVGEAAVWKQMWVRALAEAGRFNDIVTATEALTGPDASDPRRWDLLRMRAQALGALARPAEAALTRGAALQALQSAAALLPETEREAFLSQPTAQRLRPESEPPLAARIGADRLLDTMYSIVEALTGFENLDAMLERILDRALEILGAERGLILLFPIEGGDPQPCARRNLEDDTIADAVQWSRRVVEEGRLGRSLLAPDASTDPRLRDYKSVSRYRIRSVLCVPLRSRERIIGTVYLDSRQRAIGFDQGDLEFLEAFAGHAATAIENARQIRVLERDNLRLREEVRKRYAETRMVAGSAVMQEVFATLRIAAGSHLPVLIRGESGTGKELAARFVHFNSPRRDRAFVSENCAALPETLLESQLFGHVRGAFTGAGGDQRGLLLEADGGTLFLDEIGEMSAALQSRLTRVLETGEVRPVGSSTTIRVDVRLVAATHRDLEEMARRNLFRRDLLFRLNVLGVDLPPLRARRDDMPALVSHFLTDMAREADMPAPGVDDAALALLAAQPWPGNIRQLRNELGRLLLFRPGTVITAADVRRITLASRPTPDSIDASAPQPDGAEGEADLPLRDIELRHIKSALRAAGGDRARAAALLGVGRATVFRKIRRHEIDT